MKNILSEGYAINISGNTTGAITMLAVQSSEVFESITTDFDWQRKSCCDGSGEESYHYRLHSMALISHVNLLVSSLRKG